MEKISLEEHFRVPNMPEYSGSGQYFSDQTAVERLEELLADFDDLRLQAMGEANVTRAILSHTFPGLGATTDKNNPGEAKIREGLLDAMWPATFPSGEGSDLAGIVTKVGPGVERFKLDD
jgi:hypothetical protein